MARTGDPHEHASDGGRRASDAVGETTPPRLRNVFLHVTRACNLRCTYCYISGGRPYPDELTTDELRDVLLQLLDVRPEKVVITGGEPLLRPDLVGLLREFREQDPQRDVRLCLNSNGHLVDEALLPRLRGVIDDVRISLDAMAERNDAARGGGSFAAAVRALDLLRRWGFAPRAAVTVTPEGQADLEDLIAFLLERHITRIRVNLVNPIGRAAGGAYLVDRRPVREAIQRAWSRHFPGDPPPDDATESGCQVNCGVGRFLNVLPNGEAFPCHVLEYPAFRCGNVRERPLRVLCEETGLLGGLRRLDFRDLAGAEPRTAVLTERGACLGLVYRATPDLEVWKRSIPRAQVQGLRARLS